MTNNGMLSQEEIDALLNDDTPTNTTPAVEQAPNLDDSLTPIQQDALGEIGNISFGSAATALSTLLNQKVDITTPKVTLINNNELSQVFPDPYVSVFVKFTEGFEGSNVLMIKTEDAKIIADIMLGGDGTSPSDDLGEIHLSAVQEAMNQMMGSSATSMSTVFNKKVDISPPAIQLMDVKSQQGVDSIPQDERLIKVSFNLKISNLVDSDIMQLLPVDFARQLVDTLLEPEEAVNQPTQEPRLSENNVQSNQQAQVQSHTYEEKERKAKELQNVQPVSFSEFDQSISQPRNEPQNLDLLLDIPLKVSVELGKAKRTVKQILDLAPGSIVELDKLAGEHVDILINNKPIAKGEVVVIDENFGVRVTEILSQKERLRKLN